MITRPDRKLSQTTGKSIENIKIENHQLNKKIMEQLNVQTDVFIDYLRGKEVEVED